MRYQESLLPGLESIAAESARHENERLRIQGVEDCCKRADKVLEDLKAVIMTIKMLHS